MTAAPRLIVGAYHCDSLLGRGATADVYEARVTGNAEAKAVALKVGAGDDAGAWLSREAEVLSRVEHPHVVGLVDVVRADDGGIRGVALELLHGTPLSVIRAKRGPLPWREVVEVIAQIADGLGAIHHAGFLHCDVKPANVICVGGSLDADLRAVLFDLGSAVELRERRDRGEAGAGDGKPMATATHASPERALGLELGPESDVYSLAVTAFELLTGVLPFTGNTDEEILWKHVHRDAPLVDHVNPSLEIPPTVAAAVQRGLAKLPSSRYATAKQLADALRAPVHAAASDTRDATREWEARRALLDGVRTAWLEGVLQATSGGLALIPQEQSVRFGASAASWSSGPLSRVFEKARGRILIMAPAGFGKTVQLLRLLRELLDRRSRIDSGLPMPVVFSMSEWGHHRGSLQAWMVRELRSKYGVTSDDARRWVGRGQILPFFDGLDEVAPAERRACIAAINAHLAHPGAAIVATCRSQTPDMPIETLDVGATIELGQLADATTARYLAGDWLPLRNAMQGSTDLVELARSPLMLQLLRASIREGVFQDLPERGTSLVTWVYRQFVSATFASGRARDIERGTFEPRMNVVASRMQDLEHGMLLLEELQPLWLRRTRLRTAYLWTSRAIVALLLTTASIPSNAYSPLDNQGFKTTPAFAASLAFATAFWLTCGFVAWAFRPPGKLAGIVHVLGLGAVLGVLTGATLSYFDHPMVWVFALEAGLMGAVVMGLSRRKRAFPEEDIGTVERLGWSWRRVRPKTWGALALVVIAFVVGFTFLQSFRNGLVMGSLVGVIGTAIAASRHERLATKVTPNHGIHRSIRSSALGAFLAFAVTFTSVGMSYGFGYAALCAVLPAVLAGLWFGGTDVVYHYVLRAFLALEQSLPLRSSQMLDRAVDLGFMRRVGNGYMFAHATLRDYFARRKD